MTLNSTICAHPADLWLTTSISFPRYIGYSTMLTTLCQLLRCINKVHVKHICRINQFLRSPGITLKLPFSHTAFAHRIANL